MFLATGNPSMIQQALVDGPLWSLFVMPGALTAIGLCVTRVLSGEVDENWNFEEGASILSFIAIIVLFVLTLCHIPSAIQAKGVVDEAQVATSAVAIISNIITIPSAIAVGNVFINLPQLLHKVDATNDK